MKRLFSGDLAWPGLDCALRLTLRSSVLSAMRLRLTEGRGLRGQALGDTVCPQIRERGYGDAPRGGIWGATEE